MASYSLGDPHSCPLHIGHTGEVVQYIATGIAIAIIRKNPNIIGPRLISPVYIEEAPSIVPKRKNIVNVATTINFLAPDMSRLADTF